MAEVTYVPSTAADGWRAAVAADAIAVLSPAVTAQTADAVWRRLDGGGIGALVEALTGAFGTSLTAIPPFALVMVEGDDLRVAVRGPLEVVVEAEGGAASVSGRGVATWAERIFPHVHRVTVVLDGAPDETQALPIVSGVVPTDGVVLVLTGQPGKVASVPAPAERAPGRVDSPADSAPALSEPAAPAHPDDSAQANSPAQPDNPAHLDDPAQADDSAHADAPPTSEPETPPEPEPEPTAEPKTPGPSEDVPQPEAAAAETTMSATTMSAATTTNEPSGSDTWIPAGPELVDAVPLTAPQPADDSTIAVPRPAPGAAWAATVARGDAAVQPPAADGAVRGDHDGATISVAEARALRGLPAAFEPAAFEPVADVPARHPKRGRVRLSSGQVVELERPVVIGRRPRSTRASGAELPTLVAVDSPEGDISRSHVEIRAEGEHVLVTDLATTNGTVLRRVGQDPVRLHPQEPTMVVTGDTLDLGDGVTVTFEDLP
jgi:hypothetical protein